jgi:hypothetical protein
MSDDRNDQGAAGGSSAAKPTDEELPDVMTKAQASDEIERLQRVTGRGQTDDESLADRVEAEGIVDQQAMLLDRDDEST